MKTKHRFLPRRSLPCIAGSCLLLVVSQTVWCSPTSKEYVDGQINQLRGMLTGLQNEIHQLALHNQLIDAALNQQVGQTQVIEARINKLQHAVGEAYQGGIIFYVDESGQHGLVAAKMDVNEGASLEWQNGESGEKTINAKGNGLFAGFSNTQLIIAEQTIDDQNGIFAALAAHHFSTREDGMTACDETHRCYGNWYLPSAFELSLLRTTLHLNGLGGFSNAPYWSSTEHSVSEARQLDFGEGALQVAPKSSLAKVRPIHAF